MGLLSSFCRAVGRAVGRGVETVGKIIHSEKTQEVGRKIQDACRETAVSTGRQREYDQDTATERETRQIADILSSFSLGLNSQAGSIEVMAQQTVKQYFDNLTAAIQGVMGNNAMVRTLKSQKNIISSNIPGKLRDVLAKRVALTDSECSRILKMPAGTEKEKAMNDFGHKVIQEGLDALETEASGRQHQRQGKRHACSGGTAVRERNGFGFTGGSISGWFLERDRSAEYGGYSEFDRAVPSAGAAH